MGPGKEVVVIFKNARYHGNGVIKEIDEDFPVRRNKIRIRVVLPLGEVAGFRIH